MRTHPGRSVVDAPHIVGSTLPERFAARVRSTPGTVACWSETPDGFRPTTWAELRDVVTAFGTGLAALGHARGDAVAILGPTRPEWTITNLGAVGIGGVVAGIYPTLNTDGIGYVIDHSGATTVVVSGEIDLERVLEIANGMPRVERIIAWDPVDGSRDRRIVPYDAVIARGEAELAADPAAFSDLAERVRPEDHASIVYTSGTTGPPKGAVLTHASISVVMDAMQDLFGNLGPDDVTIAFLPLAHVAGQVLEQFGRIQIGFGAYYCPDPKRVAEYFDTARPTLFGSVPRVFEKVVARVHATVAHEPQPKRTIARWALKHPRTGLAYRIADRLVLHKIRAVFGGRCKLFIVGAAPVAYDVLEFCETIGVPIYEVYGMTETSSLISANRPGAQKLGTVGQVIAGGEMKLAEDGEILYRGPNLFTGYLHDDMATRATFTPDGWLKTGDVGTIDEDGYLRIVDRKKDLIITAGGKNISPSNIENLLREIPLVGEVLVHGDRRKYLSALLSLDADELRAFAGDVKEFLEGEVAKVNARLARVEQIRAWDIARDPFSIENGTLTPTLKLKRRVVEQRYADQLEALYPDD